jgi:hypothetical protein
VSIHLASTHLASTHLASIHLASIHSNPHTYRHLAVRIVYQAVKDLLNPTESPGNRGSAREFLAGSSMLSFWCEVGGFETRAVMCRAQALVDREPALRG